MKLLEICNAILNGNFKGMTISELHQEIEMDGANRGMDETVLLRKLVQAGYNIGFADGCKSEREFLE